MEGVKLKISDAQGTFLLPNKINENAKFLSIEKRGNFTEKTGQ